jgi:F0F1-type ATP synthase assembly protein I
MKNLLFVVAGLLLVIWAIAFFGFYSYGIVTILLPIAGFILLIRFVFNKQLSRK